jgi:hypothetical protein
MGLQYKIVYKKGNTNLADDVLSRQLTPVHSVSMATPRWLEIVIEGYTTDPKAKKLYE